MSKKKAAKAQQTAAPAQQAAPKLSAPLPAKLIAAGKSPHGHGL